MCVLILLDKDLLFSQLTDEIQYYWLAFQGVDSCVMRDDDCGLGFCVADLMLTFQYLLKVIV